MKKRGFLLIGLILSLLALAITGIIVSENMISLQGSVVKSLNEADTQDMSMTKPSLAPTLIQENGEIVELSTYMVEFNTKPIVYKNVDARKRGLAQAALKSETLKYKQQLALERSQRKKDIQSSLGITIRSKDSPQGGVRRLFREYDTVLNAIALELTEKEAEKIRKLPGIKAVYLSVPMQADLDIAVPVINADDAWPIIGPNGGTLTGSGMTIGVIDTGVDYTHPDLGGCFGPGCKVAGGYDFVNEDDNPMDDNMHGTHVASTAAGNGIKKGVAPDAKIYAYKVLNENGAGNSVDIIAAIERCADPNNDGDTSDHLDVCTMSLSGISNPDTGESVAADTAVLAGSIVTASAGNNGPGERTIGCPGCARNVLTVGASQSCKPGSCSGDPIAYFSSRGPVVWTDSTGTARTLQKPDIVAPGVSLCAAKLTGLSGSCLGSDRHIALSGTSMSTPMVAGLAAILRQALPSATALEIKQLIMDTAVPYSNVDVNAQGKGLVDALAALQRISPTLNFAPKIYTAPYSVEIVDNLTQSQYSEQKAVTIINALSQEVTADLSVSQQSPGLNVQLGQTRVTLAANGQVTLPMTVSVDNSAIISPDPLTAVVSITSPAATHSFWVQVTVPNRIKANNKVEFPLAVPGSGTWTGDVSVQVTDLQQKSATYSISSECCVNAGDQKPIQGIVVSTPSEIAVNAGQTNQFTATAQLDLAKIPNGVYKGNIIISSQNQRPIKVPFKIIKYYRLKVIFPENEHPIALYATDSWNYKESAAPGLENYVYFYLNDKSLPIDVIAQWQRNTPTDPTSPITYIYIAQENMQITGDNSVSVDPNSANIEIKQQYTDLQGNTISRPLQKFFMQNRNNPFMIYTVGNSGLKPLTYKFNQISSDYTFAFYAFNYTTGSTNPGIMFEHIIDNGMTESKTLTNTPADLTKIPITLHNAPAKPLNLRIFACARLSSASEDCYGIYNAIANATNNWVYDLYVLRPSNIKNSPLRYPVKVVQVYDGTNMIHASAEMQFDKTGIIRWLRNSNRYYAPGNKQPQLIDAPNTDRIDLWLNPPVPQASWYITNQFQRLFLKYSELAIGSEGCDVDLNWNYALYRQGQIVKQAATTSNIYFDSTTTSQTGLYNLVLTSQETRGAKTLAYKYNSSFLLPVGTGRNSEPPSLTSLTLSSDSITADAFDPARQNKLRFKLAPGKHEDNFMPTDTDSISSASVRVKTDQAAWQDVSATFSTAYQRYEANLPTLTGTVYTIEITADDSYQNRMVYTFDIPFGAVSGLSNTNTEAPAEADTQPPTVALQYPKNNEVVSGMMTLQGLFSDNKAIARINYFMDGQYLLGGFSSVTFLIINTSAHSDGVHTFQAEAKDTSDNTAKSEVISVTFSNAKQVDNTAPTIAITKPAQSEQVSGPVIIEATATDNVAIDRVEFKINGNLVKTDNSPVYDYSWDTNLLPTGTYSISAQAFDTSGNSAVSTISVNVVRLTDTQSPTTPTGLRTTLVSENLVDLAWSASTDNVGVIGYKLYRNNIEIGRPSSLVFSDASVNPGTTYNYQVSAYDAAGLESALSSALAVTTPVPPPVIPPTMVTGNVKNSTSAILGALVEATVSGLRGKTVRITSALTNANGDYALTLSPGKYNLTASASGYTKKTTGIDILEGQTLVVNYILDKILAAGGKRK